MFYQETDTIKSEDGNFIDDNRDTEVHGLLQPTRAKSAGDPEPAAALEYRYTTSSKLTYLLVWTLLDIAITIVNKIALQQFPFAWLLTCLHCSTVSLGCTCMYIAGFIPLSKLTLREHFSIAAFSTLFTLNIAISNVALSLVSVPFHQVVRALVPIFTIIIQKIAFRRSYSVQTYVSLGPIIFGVALATYGDYTFTKLGLLMTLISALLATIKAIASNQFMTGRLEISAPELLLRLSPFALSQTMFFAFTTGEHSRLLGFVNGLTGKQISLLHNTLGIDCAIAFALNFASLAANKRAGPLAMAVIANVKQCLTVAIGAVLFKVVINTLNAFGTVTALVGAAWFSMVEVNAKLRQRLQEDD